MKTSIPSDVWEKKKALIARLYKDEEWPLKQVIKQIRTADFNPSETQLRSRLKKWRVTKPSRQTRKKPAGDNADNDDEEEEAASEEMSPVETKNNNKLHTINTNITTAANITTPPSATSATATATAAAATAATIAMPTPPSQPDLALTREWYPADVWVQSQHEHSLPPQTVVVTQADAQSWPASVSAPSPINHTTPDQHGAVSQINTPAVTQFPTHTLPAYDLSHQQPQQQQQPQQLPSPISIPPTTLPASTHVLSPSYVAPAYGMAPISYPQPAPASHWPTGTEYIEPDTPQPGTMAMQPTNWYASLYDVAKVTAPAPVPVPVSVPDAAAAYYQRMNPAAMNGYSQVMQHMATQDMSYQAQAQSHAQPQSQPQQQQQQQQQPPMAASYQSYDEGVSVRPWRRAMTSHYSNNPESAPLVRVDRQGRQRKPPSDRKRKEDDEQQPGVATVAEEEMELLAQQQQQQQQHIQSIQQQQQQQQMHPAYQPQHHHQPQHPQYIAAGHHPHTLMPHDIYAYAGHEQLLMQRPLH